MNTYGYSNSNSLRFYDPDGRDFREKLDSLFDAGPVDALNAGTEHADAAAQDARNSGLPGAHNGAQDAFRHCVWSCRMGSALPLSDAMQIGINHEEAGNRQGQPANEAAMDLFNNDVGLLCSLSNPQNEASSCPSKCTAKLTSGELQLSP